MAVEVGEKFRAEQALRSLAAAGKNPKESPRPLFAGKGRGPRFQKRHREKGGDVGKGVQIEGNRILEGIDFEGGKKFRGRRRTPLLVGKNSHRKTFIIRGRGSDSRVTKWFVFTSFKKKNSTPQRHRRMLWKDTSTTLVGRLIAVPTSLEKKKKEEKVFGREPPILQKKVVA